LSLAFLLSRERQFGMATIEENEGVSGKMEIGNNGSGISEVRRRRIWAERSGARYTMLYAPVGSERPKGAESHGGIAPTAFKTDV